MPSAGESSQLDAPAPTARAILLRTVIAIAVAELLVGLLMAGLEPDALGLAPGLIHTLLSITLAAPIIALWVVRPLVRGYRSALHQARHLALHDPLTGLPNRRLLYEHLEKCISRLTRHGETAALLYLDLDGFKAINDRYGHAAGDAVLAALSRRTQRIVRAEDVFARLGGDEFMLLLQNAGKNADLARGSAARVAIKIQRLLAEPVMFASHRITLACSIGINLIEPGQTESARKAIQEADIAMYAAKRSAPGSILFAAQSQLHTYPFIETGHAQIDAEHRAIEEQIRQVEAEQIEPSQLLESLQDHLLSEAQIAHGIGNHLKPEHQREHQRIEQWAGEVVGELARGPRPDLLEELRAALRRHIIEFDLELVNPGAMDTVQRPAID